MRSYTLIAIAVIVIGAIFFVLNNRDTGTTTGGDTEFNKIASASSLVDYSGNTVSLDQFKNKPLVINSWAVWCPFCREELADFAQLQKEFQNRVVVIAIDRQETFKKAKGFTDELGITGDMLFLLDSSDSFYKLIGGFSMPETIFVNSSGKIIVHKRGPMDLFEMREHTNKIVE